MRAVGFKNFNADSLKTWLNRSLPNGVFVVEHKASGVIAATTLAAHNPSEFHPFGGELGWVATHPKHRGKRLSAVTCAAVTKRFLAAGYRRIYLKTDDWRLPAIKIYLQLGYVPFLCAPDMNERWRSACEKLAWPFTPKKWPQTPLAARPTAQKSFARKKSQLFLGIDLGTTGVKVGLLDEKGRMAAGAQRETHLETPAPGFSEFDAETYVGAVRECVKEVMTVAQAAPQAVGGVSFSSQAQTFVLLDEQGRLLRKAVSWLDVRAAKEAEELTRISKAAGGPAVSALAAAPKILWLRRHEPKIVKTLGQVQLLPDYLIFRLTGRSASDPIIAGSSGTYDSSSGKRLAAVLDACGLTARMLPEVFPPGTRAGSITAKAAEEFGLREGTPIVVGTNDQYVAALGAGNVAPGRASVSLGTALAMIVSTADGKNSPRGISIGRHPAATPQKPLYALLAFAKTSGIVLRWFRDQFLPGASYEKLFSAAAEAPIGAEGLSCSPHFSGTATPDFRPEVRGAFVGLHLGHKPGHLARALIESLTFNLAEHVERIRPLQPIKSLRMIGGGSKSDLWLQMFADVTGLPVERVAAPEAACLGAAELAMTGVGLFSSAAEASEKLFSSSKTFTPDKNKQADYAAAHARCREQFQKTFG
jgi:xylulokinase